MPPNWWDKTGPRSSLSVVAMGTGSFRKPVEDESEEWEKFNNFEGSGLGAAVIVRDRSLQNSLPICRG